MDTVAVKAVSDWLNYDRAGKDTVAVKAKSDWLMYEVHWQGILSP